MTVLTRTRRGRGTAPAGPAPRRPRRRSVPLAAAGVVLVVACALVFGWLRSGNRQPVLALARPVVAGQVITGSDLETVRASADGPVSLVPASRQAQVAGSTAAVTMPAGTLLAGADIGTPPPAAGQVRLGVALKPGQYPPDLAPGEDVDVLSAPASGTSGSPSGSSGSSGPGSGGAALPAGQAVVLSVSPAPAQGGTGETVAELQVSRDAMPQVAAAAAAGQITLAAIPAGG